MKALYLIIAFAPRSGAHFNPAVTLALALRGTLPRGDVAPYLLAQCVGAQQAAFASFTSMRVSSP